MSELSGRRSTSGALGGLARRHTLWPLPALAVYGLVVLLSRRVWTDVIVTHTRSGAAVSWSVAERYLLLAAVTSILYWATYVGGAAAFARFRGARAASEAEQGCALWLVRGALLFALYYGAWRLVRY